MITLIKKSIHTLELMKNHRRVDSYPKATTIFKDRSIKELWQKLDTGKMCEKVFLKEAGAIVGPVVTRLESN